MGHVNNAVYLRWVQEAVLAHWARIAPPREAARRLWIALKHEITYCRAAFLGDEVDAEAVLQSLRGARATYRTTVVRGSERLAEVVSQWCSVDAVRRRPLRLARELLDALGEPCDIALD